MANLNLDEPIELASYDPSWPRVGACAVAELTAILDDLKPTIEHIGSTAIVGMTAKPVIDLMLDIERPDDIDEVVKRLYRLGWQDLGEAGVPGRRYLRRRNGLPANLHLIRKSSDLWIDNLCLRDFLRSHPVEASEYGALKLKLVREGHRGLLAYSTAKAANMHDLIDKARHWARSPE